MTKSFSDMKPTNEACWSGYKQVGFKKKNGRNVPNCVKEELVDLVLGKDYVFEGVEDMYKGKLNQAQINTIKNTWQHKKTLLPQDKERVKKFLDNMDQFTKMQLKQANIKHVSAMIEENELDFSQPLTDILEDVEFRAAVRGQELKEFSDDELNKLAIAYKDLAGKTMSVQNANKLRKLFDRIPDSSLDKLRKKKIPFLSGLALSRMIQKKMPVRESAYEDYADFEGVEELQEARWEIEGRVSYRGIGSEDSFHMVIDAPNESAAEAKVEKELDKARDRRKIGPGGGGSVDDFEIETIERTTDRLSPPETFRGMNDFNPALKEAKFTIEYEVESDSRADDRYVGEDEMTVNASSPKEAAKKFAQEMNKLVKKAGRTSSSVLKVYMTDMDRDGNPLSDSEVKKLDDMANNIIYEADLTKSQVKKVHKMADKLPKKDFMKRYGKDGDSVRYATATNMLKKKMGIGESKFKLNKGELKMSESYKERFDSAMGHLGISSLGELNPEDQKPFFAFVDDLKEGLSAAQKKLPPALQKAILKKQDKKEVHKPGHKGDIKGALKTEDLVGGQKKLDKDKDGDLDAKDFAMLRKSGTKKEGGPGSGPQPGDGAKYKTGHKKTVMKPGAGARPGSAPDGGQTDKEADDYDTEINAQKKMMKKEALGQEPIKKMDSKGTEGGAKKDADMSKVKDAPKAKEGMKAVSGTKQVSENKKYLQTKPGSLEEAVLKTRGLIK
jgi:hypothetical protein